MARLHCARHTIALRALGRHKPVPRVAGENSNGNRAAGQSSRHALRLPPAKQPDLGRNARRRMAPNSEVADCPSPGGLKRRLAHDRVAPTGTRDPSNIGSSRRRRAACDTVAVIFTESHALSGCHGRLKGESGFRCRGGTRSAGPHGDLMFGDPPCRLLLTVRAEDGAMAFR